MTKGPFIVLEGGEGSGKSTQTKLLAERMQEAGFKVNVTREPGGTPGAELIRKLLVEGEPERWNPISEALLFAAARFDHIERGIKPSLERGEAVISDRYILSSKVYQGIVRQLGMGTITRLHDMFGPMLQPDLTIVIDIDPAVGLARAQERGIQQRFERFPIEFHRQIRNVYQHIAFTTPNIGLVSGHFEIARIAATIWSMVTEAGLHRPQVD